MAELHETMYGRKLLEHDIPEISRQLKRIADLLEKSLNQDAEKEKLVKFKEKLTQKKLPILRERKLLYNIEEIIKIVNSVQQVKDYHIDTSQLVIIFKEEIILFNIDIIKYHLEQVEEFKNILNMYSIKNENTQITIDLIL
jgi:RNase adaptor protein for sRNA GlmZ degradation